MKNKKVIFTVQGEGRGHMTQAIALAQLLRAEGAQICAVIVGCNPERNIPAFFTETFKCEIIKTESPNFVYNKKLKSVDILRTGLRTISGLGKYMKSIRKINRTCILLKPDLIINFYEPLTGLYNFIYGKQINTISIAHQYVYMHSKFKFPAGNKLERSAIKKYTQVTCFGSSKKIALSFYDLGVDSDQTIKVTAPLLREEIFETTISENNFLLVYLLNSYYIEDIIAWHEKNEDVEIHCFTDQGYTYDTVHYGKNLHVHKLSDKKFIEYMSKSKAVISTAGFESVSEAMYMGKPVLMIPVAGHFEQYCNSRDAAKAGAGIYDSYFNIDSILNYANTGKYSTSTFKTWISHAKSQLLLELSDVPSK